MRRGADFKSSYAHKGFVAFFLRVHPPTSVGFSAHAAVGLRAAKRPCSPKTSLVADATNGFTHGRVISLKDKHVLFRKTGFTTGKTGLTSSGQSRDGYGTRWRGSAQRLVSFRRLSRMSAYAPLIPLRSDPPPVLKHPKTLAVGMSGRANTPFISAGAPKSAVPARLIRSYGFLTG